jgi:hypothetical protein
MIPRAEIERRLSELGTPPVRERKVKPTGEVSEEPCRLIEMAPSHIVLFHLVTGEWEVGPYVITPPMFTIAFYWKDTPYNSYTWFDEDGGFVAGYFNLAGAEGYRLEDDEGLKASGDEQGRGSGELLLEYRDLLLDVVVHPSGRVELEDEEELKLLDSETRARVVDTAEVLKAQGVSIVGRAVAGTRLGGQ